MKKTRKFRLKRSTTLVPLSGNTEVLVITDGCFSMHTKAEGSGDRGVLELAHTRNARMHISRGGRSITMTIHLPPEKAFIDAFVDSACMVYGKYLENIERAN